MINPDDKFISFPDGVNIFGSKGFGSAFIICECYKDLWKLITEDKNYNGNQAQELRQETIDQI
ncbi:9411_t:CDS:2 [Entrophospora sp. SA101]|nr:9411_t:CDS:2 [Entrophospora sp. SA101]